MGTVGNWAVGRGREQDMGVRAINQDIQQIPGKVLVQVMSAWLIWKNRTWSKSMDLQFLITSLFLVRFMPISIQNLSDHFTRHLTLTNDSKHMACKYKFWILCQVTISLQLQTLLKTQASKQTTVDHCPMSCSKYVPNSCVGRAYLPA